MSNGLYYDVQLGYFIDPPSGVIHGRKEAFESVAQTLVLIRGVDIEMGCGQIGAVDIEQHLFINGNLYQ